MQIPRHWARVKGATEDPSGKPYALSVWGWSANSNAEAVQVAERRLAEARARIAKGAREDAGAQRKHEAWLSEYEAAIRSKATCSLVESVGFGRTSEEARAIVDEHDRACRVGETLPLA
jgi:hypothetical protein